VNKKQLQRFIENYKKQYDEDISEDEAAKLASQIIEIYRAVFGDPLLNLKNNKENERK
jgi:20S proteasome alpha/beta subunit